MSRWHNTYAPVEACGINGGLFPPTRELLRHMERLGMILDITHSSDRSAAESLDSFGGPVVASHHACLALVPGERGDTDGQGGCPFGVASDS